MTDQYTPADLEALAAHPPVPARNHVAGVHSEPFRPRHTNYGLVIVATSVGAVVGVTVGFLAGVFL